MGDSLNQVAFYPVQVQPLSSVFIKELTVDSNNTINMTAYLSHPRNSLSKTIPVITIWANLFDNDGLLNQAQTWVGIASIEQVDSANMIGDIRQMFAYKNYTVVKAKV